MSVFGNDQKYMDEISDQRDIGGMLIQLLCVRQYGVKSELWSLLEEALSDETMDELKEQISAYWDEVNER
jgi:hypothetical protein